MSLLRRILSGIVFVSIALSVVIGAHYYLVRRLILEPEWSAPLTDALVAAVIALGLSIVALLAAERLLGPPWVRIVAWPPSIWLGHGFLCLCLTAVTDVALVFVDATAAAALAPLRALVVVGAATLVVLLTVPRALGAPAVRRVEVALARWPKALDRYRIAQITDVHIGPILGRRFARAVTERVNALDADLVVVTGDLVDGAVSRLGEEVSPFGELRAGDGVYFVTGNHDYYSNASEWVAHVEGLGMRVLRNELVRIGEGERAFDLAGVEDHRASSVDPRWRSDVEAALEGRDPDGPVVLLAHDPTTFRRARRRGVDLQLSGHTHGGQIWPFHYFVRLVVPWIAGLHRDGPASLYVSRGTGFWGPPMRLGAPAEITEIVLRATSESVGASRSPVEPGLAGRAAERAEL